jgi:hypothetical protein
VIAAIKEFGQWHRARYPAGNSQDDTRDDRFREALYNNSIFVFDPDGPNFRFIQINLASFNEEYAIEQARKLALSTASSTSASTGLANRERFSSKPSPSTCHNAYRDVAKMFERQVTRNTGGATLPNLNVGRGERVGLLWQGEGPKNVESRAVNQMMGVVTKEGSRVEYDLGNPDDMLERALRFKPSKILIFGDEDRSSVLGPADWKGIPVERVVTAGIVDDGNLLQNGE